MIFKENEGVSSSETREHTAWMKWKFVWFCSNLGMSVNGYKENILKILVDIEA